MENNPHNQRDETINLLGSTNSDSDEGPSSLVGNIRIGRVNFQRRTAEGSRLLRENFHTVFEEIRPLVEQARTVNQNGISFSTLLNRQQSRNEIASTAGEMRDSFVINLGDSSQGQMNQQVLNNANNSTHIHNHSTDNFLNNMREAGASLEQATTNNNNNTEEATAAEALRQVPEARALLEILQKYVPFVLILLAKGLYDHREGILNFIILFICFSHSNSVVKREAGKQGRRSLTALLAQVCYIFGCILFIGYIFEEEKLFSNLIFIPPYTQPLSVWDLLWTVGITDFILKLITIFLKILIVALPAQLIPYQKRVSIVYDITRNVNVIHLRSHN